MRKNILVVNDDGIEAVGIHKLAEALSDEGDVYVCSPHKQQSGSGHGITIGQPVYASDIFFKEARQAVLLEGTPVDCVKIGLEIYRERGLEMDMVFSGFNHGMNLGTDTLYSGTVSAAVEGALCGLPSAAMSISSNRSFHRTPANFEAAMKMAKHVAGSKLFQKRIGGNPNSFDINYIYEEHIILSINVPDMPPEDIKGVKVCPLSYRTYLGWCQEKSDEDGRMGYYYSGKPLVLGQAGVDDSDIIANQCGFATITPLHVDLTNHGKIEALRSEWEGYLV